ncbi:serine/threonine-protein kinase [Psychromonas arctica]|uniref:serine/threonine-protein kinase n=1 Tax=Psychromonas arctica TaxID=168275 RepID=UPI002FCE6B6A
MENTISPDNDDKTVISKKGINLEINQKASNLIGKCFSQRYLIESQIGAGGMSDVYRAVDLTLKDAGIEDAFVAIKVLQKQFSEMKDAQKILINEALQTQKLSHPNIIRVYDIKSDGNYHFMVMEWLDGESLDQVINSSKPVGTPFVKTKKIIDQIGSALNYAHQEGLIHTDLKPSNIFLTRKGNIKIFDFGVSKLLNEDEDNEYVLQNNDQDTALNGHTPAYASFEQLNGDSPTQQDDVFSFACIIYELLSSKHPYKRTAANKVNKSSFTLVKPKNISLSHWSVLKRGLAINKAERLNTIDELVTPFSSKVSTKILAGALLLAVVGYSANAFYQQSTEIEKLTSTISEYDQETKTFNSYGSLPASEFLAKADEIKESNFLIAQALFRQHHDELITLYDEKIQNAPKLSNNKFKDYAKVNTILAEAFTYYPDSFRLKEIQKQQETSRETTINAIVEKLDQLLIQGRYSEAGDNNIKNLFSDLSLLLLPGEEYVATEKAFALFQRKFNLAIDKKDFKTLDELIRVGDIAFYNYPEADKVIASSKKMASAVNALAKYAADYKKSPENAVYPHEEATLFYKKEINDMSEELSKARNYNAYIAVGRKINRFAQQFPKDFQPIIDLKRQEASDFFAYSNRLMEIRSFIRAKNLINRGNAILKELDGE